MANLIQIFESIGPLSAELKFHLQTIVKTATYKKKDYLLKQGRVCRNVWFIEKGLVGAFYEKSDRTLCAWFMKEGDFVTSVASFFRQSVSYENIKVLDDLIVHHISYDELQWIYGHFPEFNFHGRVLVQQYYIMAEERMRAFHNQSPEEKYRYIMSNFPDLILRVSSKNLASYMGISEETLSRVKSRI